MPRITTETDVSYFDPVFTNEPVILTPSDKASIFDQHFDGFSFVAEKTVPA